MTGGMIRPLGLAFLASLAAGLIYANWALQNGGGSELATPEQSKIAAWQPDLSQGSDQKFLPPEISDFKETLVRPLFSRTRKPAQAKPPPPLPPPPPPVAQPPAVPLIQADQFQLMGVVIENNEKQALIRSPNAQQGNWLKEGAQIDGWTLTRIFLDRAVVEGNGAQSELRLYGNSGPQAPR